MNATPREKRPRLSLVIPAYNEEKRIGSTLEAVCAFLDKHLPGAYEVIVVNDGSGDGTADKVTEFARRIPQARLLENPGNRGKGYSVRHGMLTGRGEHLIFSDADLSTPIEESLKILDALKRADVAVASRRLGKSILEIKQPWYRELMGRGFNLVVQTLAVRGITDTQCGFKGLTRPAARAVFERTAIDRFGFDVEVLFLARKLGLSIVEVPVRWIDEPDSRVDPIRDPMRMFLEVVQVRRNEMKGCYRDWGKGSRGKGKGVRAKGEGGRLKV